MTRQRKPLRKKDRALTQIRESWDYEYHDPIDPTIEFFYKPHNITILLIIIAILVYIAIFVLQDDPVFNVKIGISCAVGVLAVIGMLSFKDGPFIRPRKMSEIE